MLAPGGKVRICHTETVERKVPAFKQFAANKIDVPNVLLIRQIRFGIYVSDRDIKKEGKPKRDNLASYKLIGPASKTTPLL